MNISKLSAEELALCMCQAEKEEDKSAFVLLPTQEDVHEFLREMEYRITPLCNVSMLKFVQAIVFNKHHNVIMVGAVSDMKRLKSELPRREWNEILYDENIDDQTLFSVLGFLHIHIHLHEEESENECLDKFLSGFNIIS